MKVIILFGGVGGSNCHIEVFEDSEKGEKLVENRRRHLESLNNNSWGLNVEKFKVRG